MHAAVTSIIMVANCATVPCRFTDHCHAVRSSDSIHETDLQRLDIRSAGINFRGQSASARRTGDLVQAVSIPKHGTRQAQRQISDRQLISVANTPPTASWWHTTSAASPRVAGMVIALIRERRTRRVRSINPTCSDYHCA